MKYVQKIKWIEQILEIIIIIIIIIKLQSLWDRGGDSTFVQGSLNSTSPQTW